MKQIIIKTFIIAVTSLIFTSCDLEIQKPYNFVPDKFPEVTFESQTMWEFLQTQKSTSTVLDPFKFDLMIQAIEYTGLTEEYNRPGDQRTFLLLNNAAFTAANQINAALSGKTTTAVTALDKARLTTLMRYHIVETVVLQVPTLSAFNTQYIFQSLITGDEGRVSMVRNDRWAITVNSSRSLPTTRKQASVRTHNIKVKNGVAHVINGYARYKAF